MRVRSALVVTLLAGAGLLAASPATAAPPAAVTLTSSATGPTSGAKTDTKAVVSVAVAVTDPIGDAVFTATVPGRVEATDLTFGGTPVVAANVTVTHESNPERTEVRANVGDAATPVSGGDLAEGETYPITVTTALSSGIASPATVPSTLSYDDSGTPASQTTSTTIPLPDVVVSVPRESGQGSVLRLTPNGGTFFFAEVNHRGAAVADSTLTVSLPPGLVVDTDQGVFRFTLDDFEPTDLQCTGATTATVTCGLGKLDSTVYVAVAVRGTGAARPGTTGKLGLEVLAANGLDANRADNTISATVRFVPPPRLKTTITADDRRVETGAKAHLTVSVTNQGSEPVAVYAPIFVDNADKNGEIDDDPDRDPTFEITHFSGKQDLPGLESGGVSVTGRMTASLVRGLMRQTTLKTDRADGGLSDTDEGDAGFSDDQGVFWNAGTIAPGRTVTSVVTIKAKRVGRANAVALAISPVGISACLATAESDEDLTRCREYDDLSLRAIAATGPGGDIAATGVPAGELTGLGAALLLLGGLSLYAGRNRRRA